MLDTLFFEVVWRLLTTYSIRQFPPHFPSRASPCAITFQLDSTYVEFAWTNEGKPFTNLRESKTIPPSPNRGVTALLTCPLPNFGVCIDSVLVLHIMDCKGIRRWGSPPIWISNRVSYKSAPSNSTVTKGHTPQYDTNTRAEGNIKHRMTSLMMVVAATTGTCWNVVWLYKNLFLKSLCNAYCWNSFYITNQMTGNKKR
jgi:hypothetical protein